MATKNSKSPSRDKKRIIIIEDEKPMLEALVNKFKNEGFETLQASDGAEGLEMSLKEKPDLLLLDIIMPKIDGMTLMKKVREDKKWGKNVPIIMLTNLSDPESVSEATKYGVFDFLVKTDWRLDDVVKLAKERLKMGI